MPKLLFAALAALLLAAPARAAQLQTLRLREQPPGAVQLADVTGVSGQRSPVSIIASDTLYGGMVGLAVGAGVTLISQDGDWGRNLTVGAGVGLIAGAIYGLVSAASVSDRAMPPGFNDSLRATGGRF
jgi:hypothetical protein